jgi:hypothetical protein
MPLFRLPWVNLRQELELEWFEAKMKKERYNARHC